MGSVWPRTPKGGFARQCKDKKQERRVRPAIRPAGVAGCFRWNSGRGASL
jgi:hypothetical protein